MRYVGSKASSFPHFRWRLIADLDRLNGARYIEPFCGGCNSLVEIPAKYKRIASDVNPYLIAMWQAVVYKGWNPPPNMQKWEYEYIKTHKSEHPPELVGFTGFGVSFSAGWFIGYSGYDNGKHIGQTRDAVLRQAEQLVGVEFHCCPYWELESKIRGVESDVIYCDPPYEGTVRKNPYGAFTPCEDAFGFDTPRFWKWARSVKCGALWASNFLPVGVKGVDGFEQKWAEDVVMEMRGKTGTPRTDRLFRRRDQ